VLGERWRALTPVEKKRYEDMAAEDKVRFQMEMQQYTANQAAAQAPQHPPQHEQYHYDPTTHAGYESYAQHDPYVAHSHHQQYHT
jgi:hypothetical protein